MYTKLSDQTPKLSSVDLCNFVKLVQQPPKRDISIFPSSLGMPVDHIWILGNFVRWRTTIILKKFTHKKIRASLL